MCPACGNFCFLLLSLLFLLLYKNFPGLGRVKAFLTFVSLVSPMVSELHCFPELSLIFPSLLGLAVGRWAGMKGSGSCVLVSSLVVSLSLARLALEGFGSRPIISSPNSSLELKSWRI